MYNLRVGSRVKIDNICGLTKYPYSSTKLSTTIGKTGKIISKITENLYLIQLDESPDDRLAYYSSEITVIYDDTPGASEALPDTSQLPLS